MIFSDVTKTIGRTPIIELGRMAKGLPGRIAAKLEMRNQCGSVKDRLGVALIEDAEQRGVLRSGMTIIEATGGNTGIG
ncbi:MAG: pyridoxal-phosphate dependent enzyme, partial [Steroidobacteraceae bacterium]